MRPFADAAWRTSCCNNLKQLGLAANAYHDARLALPPGTASDRPSEPYPYMTWLNRLLPYVDQEPLWAEVCRAYAKERHFGVVPPHTHRATVVAVFACEADGRTSTPGVSPLGNEVAFTSYLGVEGLSHTNRNGVLYVDSRVNLSEVTDGTSHTLLAGERPPSADLWYGWWYAGTGQSSDGNADATLGVCDDRYSMDHNDRNCFAGPYEFGPGDVDNQCDTFHFWSLHVGGGGHFLFGDGSVRFLTYASTPILPALASRAGGEVVGDP